MMSGMVFAVSEDGPAERGGGLAWQAEGDKNLPLAHSKLA